MRLKCGLTDEEKIQRRKAEEAYWLRCLKEGEIVFAILPKRIKPGDCRWLERVRRRIVKVEKYSYQWDEWIEDERLTKALREGKFDGAASWLALGHRRPTYKYEALS